MSTLRDDGERVGAGPQVAAMAKLVHANVGNITPLQRARGLERLTYRLERRRRRRPARLLMAGGVLAVASAALVVALPRLGQSPRSGSGPLAYQVEAGSIGPGGAIVARGTGAAALDGDGGEPVVRFVDGSTVKLRSGARGRLVAVDHRGARFAIERGTAEVQVTPNPSAHWLFDAGPFLITVHGTAFSAGWDEVDGRLDVRLEHGLVSVTGPVAGGPISVRGGQRLTVTLRQARVLLRGLDEPDDAGATSAPPASAPPPPAEAPTPAAAPAPSEPSAPTSAAARAPAARAATASAGRGGHAAPSNWVTALAAGHFDAIVSEAQREGARALATRGSDDLAALADAARYRRHDTLAREALLAQRRRFAASARANDAAFLLGRLEEADAADLARAVKWYDRYLEEAPSGAYASEALGRKMVAVQKLYGRERARVVAEEYARRFPSGTYAGAARALRDAR